MEYFLRSSYLCIEQRFEFKIKKIVIIVLTDVAKEKQHTALLHDVEQFQASSLRKTDTVEKIVLPNALGIQNWREQCSVTHKRAHETAFSVFLVLPILTKIFGFSIHKN